MTPSHLLSQRSIEGKVIDSQSSEPVPFAKVQLSGETIGTLTNEEGRFTLKLGRSVLLSDSVVVSCLGYKVRKVGIYEYRSDAIIRLLPSQIELKAVEILAINGEELLKEAIKKIPVNCNQKPEELTGFYRERVKDGLGSLQFVEGVVGVLKDGYTKKDPKHEAFIAKGRSFISPQATSTDTTPLNNGPHAMTLEADYVRFFASDAVQELRRIKGYKFSVERVIQLNSIYVYVLLCTPPETQVGEDLRFYITQDTKVIVAYEVVKTGGNLAYHNAVDRYRKYSLVKYTAQYAQQNGLWYFAQSHYEMDYLDMRSGRFYKATSDYVTTQLGRLPAAEGIKVRQNQIIPRTVGKYDPSYWDQFNYIRQLETD